MIAPKYTPRPVTPGPWRTNRFGAIHATVNGERVTVAGCLKTRADAERIVACVNALDGIENPIEWVAAMRAKVQA
jgi:hypothetical protein